MLCLNSYHYLLLFSALINLRNEYLLNGHYQISPYPQTIEVLGAALFYTGSETIEERINSTGTLGEDLQLQVNRYVKLFLM